jgi:acetyltransferase-like isoleucine patch superfamily enzyme
MIGKLSLDIYRFYTRALDRLFSILISSSFAAFGKKTLIQRPLRIYGEARIEIGDNVFIGAGSWLNAMDDGDSAAPAIKIGNGSGMSGTCVISAIRGVQLEENVLLARNVYISDHIHKYDQITLPVMQQGIDKILPVLICRGAWIGQNVVICPGVTIGQGSVIGANSVVNSDIPEFSVAVGAPARVVKKIST